MDDKTYGCRIDRLSGVCAFEFISLARPSEDPGPSDWPSAPGAVRRDAAQRAMMLHFAPGRWLAPNPDSETCALLDAAAASGRGTVVEVTGKYDALSVIGSGATRLLACGIDIESVMQARDCAALTLFDCPAIISRVADGYAIWVQSSYATDFVSTVERFRTMLGGNP